MHDYQESLTTGQTDTRMDRQTPDKVIPMCRYASQVMQKPDNFTHINTCTKNPKSLEGTLLEFRPNHVELGTRVRSDSAPLLWSLPAMAGMLLCCREKSFFFFFNMGGWEVWDLYLGRLEDLLASSGEVAESDWSELTFLE